MGEIVRPPFPLSETHTVDPLVLIHTNLLDIVTPSLSGSCYALVIVNDFSWYAWEYFLKVKSMVFSTIKDWSVHLKSDP
jgi:hypothetical protein